MCLIAVEINIVLIGYISIKMYRKCAVFVDNQ